MQAMDLTAISADHAGITGGTNDLFILYPDSINYNSSRLGYAL